MAEPTITISLPKIVLKNLTAMCWRTGEPVEHLCRHIIWGWEHDLRKMDAAWQAVELELD